MERRSSRNRKISQRMAVVSDTERKRALAARLEALENDGTVQDTFAAAASDDEEFLIDVDSEGEEYEAASSSGKKKKRKRIDGGRRKTRGMSEKGRGMKGLKEWLEEVEETSEGKSNYFTAAVSAPTTRSARKLCSVCGDYAPYTCMRCGSEFCCVRCFHVHTDTRCLKFTT